MDLDFDKTQSTIFFLVLSIGASILIYGHRKFVEFG